MDEVQTKLFVMSIKVRSDTETRSPLERDAWKLQIEFRWRSTQTQTCTHHIYCVHTNRNTLNSWELDGIIVVGLMSFSTMPQVRRVSVLSSCSVGVILLCQQIMYYDSCLFVHTAI